MTNLTYTEALNLVKGHRKCDSDDIQKVLNPKSVHHLSEKNFPLAITLAGGDDNLRDVLALPQKQVKRFTQMVNACSEGLASRCDASYLRIVLALHVSPEGAQNYDALKALITRLQDQGAGGANLRGVGFSQVSALFKNYQGVSTAIAKLSGCLGNTGVLQTIGATFAPPSTKNREVTLNREHPLVRALVGLVQKSTAGQIEAIDA